MKNFKSLPLAVLFLLFCMKSNAQPCTISCPSSIVIKAPKGQEGVIVTIPPAGILGKCDTITYSPASGTFFRIGSHTVTASISTGPKCSFTITITDNEPPALSAVTLSSKRLWPASNRMKKVAVHYTTSDNAHDVTAVLSVSSNDTASVVKDWEIVDNHLVLLKTSRLSNGEPRIYTIAVTSSDEAGNKTRRTTSIAVSKTMTSL